LISSALRPCIAFQVLSAITATPFEIWTHLLDARNGLRLGSVETRDLAPNTGSPRAMRKASRLPHVDAEAGLAVHLERRIGRLMKSRSNLNWRCVLQLDSGRTGSLAAASAKLP